MKDRFSRVLIIVLTGMASLAIARDSSSPSWGSRTGGGQRSYDRSRGSGTSSFSGARTSPPRQTVSPSFRSNAGGPTSSRPATYGASGSARSWERPATVAPRAPAAPSSYTPAASAERPVSGRIFSTQPVTAPTAPRSYTPAATVERPGPASGRIFSGQTPAAPSAFRSTQQPNTNPGNRGTPLTRAPSNDRTVVTPAPLAQNTGADRSFSPPALPAPMHTDNARVSGTLRTTAAPAPTRTDMGRTVPPIREKPAASRPPTGIAGRMTAAGNDRASFRNTPDTVRRTPLSGTSDLRFGNSFTSAQKPRFPSGSSLRLPSRSGIVSLRDNDRSPLTRGIPSRIARKPGHPGPGASGFGHHSPSRYTDGRRAVYHAPDRHHPSFHHRAPYHFNPWTFGYYHHGFTPMWYGPVVYPVSGFGFAWGNGHFGLSVGSYWPAYPCTPYYDSWYSGGWGYSSLYYGGWRHGWYGGFSYIYNPWPVYRTYYLYEPEPVVTRVETVYVTQPATTTYVEAAPAPATTAAYPSAPAGETGAWGSAPAVDRVETAASTCFCSCHCNGQRPCTCDYPCGAEYAYDANAFDLSLDYTSYSESLDPETIWSSYAGFDRYETDPEPFLYEATAQNGNDPL